QAARGSKPLEVGRGAKAEELGAVEGGLEQGLGEVGAERSKRGLPDQAHAGREAHIGAVEDETSFVIDSGDGKSARVPQRAGVDKHGALETGAVRNKGQREPCLRRGGPEGLAAERIPAAIIDALAR